MLLLQHRRRTIQVTTILHRTATAKVALASQLTQSGAATTVNQNLKVIVVVDYTSCIFIITSTQCSFTREAPSPDSAEGSPVEDLVVSAEECLQICTNSRESLCLVSLPLFSPRLTDLYFFSSLCRH